MANIPDDPSIIEPIFKQIKEDYKKNITKNIEFRKESLKSLLRGYK